MSNDTRREREREKERERERGQTREERKQGSLSSFAAGKLQLSSAPGMGTAQPLRSRSKMLVNT